MEAFSLALVQVFALILVGTLSSRTYWIHSPYRENPFRFSLNFARALLEPIGTMCFDRKNGAER